MNITDIFIRRPVLATVISMLLLVLGLRALSGLPVFTGSQAPAWEPGWGSSSFPKSSPNRKLELPRLHSQAGAWEREHNLP